MTHAAIQTHSHAGAFLAGLMVSFLGLTSAHEAMLRVCGHEPAIVDDETLWCTVRRQVDTLSSDDVVLLGASRMQTDIDETKLVEAFPGRKFVNLAISGGGTSRPVFRDIVENTNFAGTAVLDETEYTMAGGDGDEQSYVAAYTDTFSFDKLVNRQVDTWLQTWLVSLGPGESCTELWPRILARRQVPPPKPTVTSATRYTRSDYSLVDPELLREIRRKRLPNPSSETDMPRTIDLAVDHWRDLIDAFRARGGRVVFVRLPVSQELWALEDAKGEASGAWRQIMQRLGVPSILCNGAEADSLGDLRILDHSHVDLAETKRFTAWLCQRLYVIE